MTYRTYGVNGTLRETIAKEQDWVCAICRSVQDVLTPSEKLDNSLLRETLHIDHEHVNDYDKLTPEQKGVYVRALLCSNCNLMLGLCRDQPEILERAAIYLRCFQR